MRILFWGTPEFATPPLRALVGEGHDVVGVVTQPDRPQGRHHSTRAPSPVKLVAEEESIPVLQPEVPRGDEFVAAIRELGADVSVVVAYGHILAPDVIALPPAGTLNIHASLLPRWRGAAPIQAVLLAGDVESGVSVLRMVPRLDAGPVLLQARTLIDGDETYGELQLRLSELGALAIVEAMTLLDLGAARDQVQDESLVTYARKIEREDALVDWQRACDEVARAVRAYDPRPGAYTLREGAEVKLFGVRVVPGAAGKPGSVQEIGKEGMLVACGTGGVRVTDVQPAGKRRLSALQWAQGRGVQVGDVLGVSGVSGS